MFQNMPPVVKNLLLLNIAIFVIATLLQITIGTDLNSILGLYYIKSDAFRPFQLITHMFMHGGFMHILFNMYALWMFGQILERVWGPKRFFIFYMFTGLGAAVLHSAVIYYQVYDVSKTMSPEAINTVFEKGLTAIQQGKNFVDASMAQLNYLIHIPTVGASGAVFGLLLGFGMLFPNTELYLMFIPIPIKAKYFVMGYGAIELFGGIANRPDDNIAHFAHLGGMLFGFIMIKIWNKDKKNFF
jgi:membrane associated rhomboid family serine protease